MPETGHGFQGWSESISKHEAGFLDERPRQLDLLHLVDMLRLAADQADKLTDDELVVLARTGPGILLELTRGKGEVVVRVLAAPGVARAAVPRFAFTPVTGARVTSRIGGLRWVHSGSVAARKQERSEREPYTFWDAKVSPADRRAHGDTVAAALDALRLGGMETWATGAQLGGQVTILVGANVSQTRTGIVAVWDPNRSSAPKLTFEAHWRLGRSGRPNEWCVKRVWVPRDPGPRVDVPLTEVSTLLAAHLAARHITTIGQLLWFKPGMLLSLRGFGPGKIAHLQQELADRFGIDWSE